MQRYFVDPARWTSSSVTIAGEDVHHIRNVMRGRIGQEILVCDGRGRTALARLAELEPSHVSAAIIEELEERRELPVRVSIAQGLPKGDKLEWILQKGTELGACAFLPFFSERTIVKIDSKKEAKKRDRWIKIVKEAGEQAHRSILPEVYSPLAFREVLAQAARYTACVIAYEKEDTMRLSSVLDRLSPGDTLLALIGPEGGFTPQEVAQAQEAGMVPVSLGPRILRTETASGYVLSAVSYHFEQR